MVPKFAEVDFPLYDWAQRVFRMEGGKQNWIKQNTEEITPTGFDLYSISLYAIVTAASTTGYGDITGTNNMERMFLAMVMFFSIFWINYTIAFIIYANFISNGLRSNDIENLNFYLKDLPSTLRSELFNSLYKDQIK